MSKGCPAIPARRGFYPHNCRSFCQDKRLGCYNAENNSKQCTYPVHLTSQWDIGFRPCCEGTSQKYTAMGGLFN